MQDLEYVQLIARTMCDKKGVDIVALDVSKLTVVCDYMVICTGRNALLTQAIAREVDDRLAEAGLALRRSEGRNEGRWIVLDYGHIIVHVFHTEERAYYNLERLWEDGTNRLPLSLDDDGPQA